MKKIEQGYELHQGDVVRINNKYSDLSYCWGDITTVTATGYVGGEPVVWLDGHGNYVARDAVDKVITSYVRRPRGNWIGINLYPGDGDLWRCNVCGGISCKPHAFCPDCGAEMALVALDGADLERMT